MIKHLILVSLSSLFLINENHGQTTVFNYGLKAGINQPFFKTSSNSGGEYTTDDNFIYAGITTDIRFTKRFSLQTELFWERDPVTYYNEGNGNSYVIQERLGYISLPILAKIYFGKLSLYGGPQFSLLTKAELPNLISSTNGQHYSQDGTDSYKKIRFAGVIGAEFVFKYRFGIDARYVVALNNVANPNGSTPLTGGPDPSVKVNNFQGGLFFRFGKKKS